MTRYLRAFGAFIVLLALLIGVPLALAGLIGNPLAGWSDLKAGDLSDTVVIDILAGIAWLAWAQFALATLIEAFSLAIRADSPRRVPGVFAGQQQLARALIAAIFILTPTVVGVLAPVASFASAPAPAAVSASQQAGPVSTPVRSAPIQAPHAESARPAESTREYLVPASGGPSTYWDLAEHYLGRGDQWRQIWQLNEGRQQADGSRMLSPGLLRPGWTVLLPEPAHTHLELEQIQVRPGDTLSGIAETAGQPDWQQAWQASADRAEPGGRQFTDPNLILPGWTVEVPVPVADAAPPAPARPAVVEQPPAVVEQQPAGQPVGQPAPVANSPIAAPQSSALVDVLEGGGALLAAGLLAALGSRRRRQFRHRRPGRAIAAAPLSVLDVERAVLAAGPAGEADVAFLDRALRSLAGQVGADGLPDLAAVRIVADQVDLRLTEPYPSAPPAPWQVDQTGYWWSVGLTDPLPLTGRAAAPYPTLVSIGTGVDGDRWLLDLARAGAVSLVGTEQISSGLARFAAAELALNGWSDHLSVTLVGFGAELVGLNPQRLSVATDLGRLADQLTAAMTAGSEADLLASRPAGVSPQVILIDPAAVTDDEALQRLLFAVRTQPARSAVSVVLLADTTHTHQTRYQLELTSTGRLHLAAFGLDLQAQQLSAEQAGAFAELVGSSDDLVDRATPVSQRGAGWTDWADQAGLLRPDLLRPSPAPSTGDGAAGVRLSAVGPLAETGPETSSLLPEPDARYLERAATTAEDIALLAPDVPRQLGAQLDDPELDADLAEWFADAPVRPRMAVLGPITVDTCGNQGAVAGRLDYYRELVARLALSENPEQLLGNTGNPDQARAIAMLSSWLGADPATGEAFLRQDAPAMSAVLTDADLFRRLRLRGQARGGRGLPDLVRALELVRGEPFGQRRIGGYGWLADSQLVDIYRGMVVDVAHLVATRALAEQDPVTARQAASAGLAAAPEDDVPLLDLVAVCTMQGFIEEREQHVRAILRKHDAEVEEDLPPRTAQILRRRGWAAAS